MTARPSFNRFNKGLPALARIAALFAVVLCLFAGGRAAQATPVVYQFTAGGYTGWISYDPATAVQDPNYLTTTSAVYRGDIVNMYETLSYDGVYNTFEVAAVVLYNSGGYYGLIFSGLSQWGYVEQDLFYYGDNPPITSLNLPPSIEQQGLSLFVYIGGQRAVDTNLQANPVINQTNDTPPVPEPSSLMLMLLGLAGIASHQMRRRGLIRVALKR